MVHWSITDFRLSIELKILSVPSKCPAELFGTQFFCHKLLVLFSDVAVQGYTLLPGMFLDHLSFLISKNRLLRQLEDFGDYIFLP